MTNRFLKRNIEKLNEVSLDVAPTTTSVEKNTTVENPPKTKKRVVKRKKLLTPNTKNVKKTKQSSTTQTTVTTTTEKPVVEATKPVVVPIEKSTTTDVVSSKKNIPWPSELPAIEYNKKLNKQNLKKYLVLNNKGESLGKIYLNKGPKGAALKYTNKFPASEEYTDIYLRQTNTEVIHHFKGRRRLKPNKEWIHCTFEEVQVKNDKGEMENKKRKIHLNQKELQRKIKRNPGMNVITFKHHSDVEFVKKLTLDDLKKEVVV